MRAPEGMTITLRETTHRCPPAGSNVMPCCDRTPFEVPERHRLAVDDAYVTCGRPFVVADVSRAAVEVEKP